MPFIVSLDLARGLFAVWVMLLHINRMVAQQSPGTFGDWSEIGKMGVDYFFVLSGFLMYYLHKKDAGDPVALQRYVVKRVSRVYPIFWFALAISLMLIPLSQSSAFPPLADIIKHIFLITPHITEDGKGRVLGVAWTLEMEMIFYAVFACWLAIKPVWGRHAFMLSGLVVAFMEPYFLLFYGGMLVAHIVLKYGPMRFGYPVMVGLLSFLFVVWVETSSLPKVIEKVCFSAGFGVLILSLINVDAKYPKWTAGLPKFFHLSGSASYTLYLMHIPVVTVLFAVMKRVDVLMTLPGWFNVLLLCVVTWAISVMISQVIEHPINRFLQKRINQRFKREAGGKALSTS